MSSNLQVPLPSLLPERRVAQICRVYASSTSKHDQERVNPPKAKPWRGMMTSAPPPTAEDRLHLLLGGLRGHGHGLGLRLGGLGVWAPSPCRAGFDRFLRD